MTTQERIDKVVESAHTNNWRIALLHLAAIVDQQQSEIQSLEEVTKHLHQQIAALKARANLAQEAQL